MKQELKENQGLPASLLWTLAIIAGISVAIEKSTFSWKQFATVSEKSNVRNRIVVI